MVRLLALYARTVQSLPSTVGKSTSTKIITWARRIWANRRGALDHNLHVFACGTLRSWNYGSQLPGNVDDWYVVGCKWTPFEVSYYLNGKLIESEANHNPYNSVTFDPFNHAAGYVPLHAILSGCCGKSGGDPTKGKFPESFFVDYVRIYEYPHDSDPVVRLTKSRTKPPLSSSLARNWISRRTSNRRANPGRKSSRCTSSTAARYWITAPLRPTVSTSKSRRITTTARISSSRDALGIRPDWDRGLHAFCVFAQDENGNVGRSENVVRLLRKHGRPAVPRKTGATAGRDHAVALR